MGSSETNYADFDSCGGKICRPIQMRFGFKSEVNELTGSSHEER